MNPFSSWSGPSWECFRLSYNFLTWYDDDYNARARSGRQLGDHERRQDVDLPHPRGVKWQDGVPLTARDIAFTYNLILDTSSPPTPSYLPA